MSDGSNFYFSLTFDDGPGPSTASLLDTLAEYKIKSTFFVLGKNILEAPWCNGDSERANNLVVRAISEGHLLGNHSYSHTRPDKISSKAFVDEIIRCDQLILSARKKAGVTLNQSIPVRIPYGVVVKDFGPDSIYSQRLLDPRLHALSSIGRSHFHWTAILDDWKLQGANEGGKLFASMVLHAEKMISLGLNAVFCLHDSGEAESFNRDATVEGVRLFLLHAKKQSWKSFNFFDELR